MMCIGAIDAIVAIGAIFQNGLHHLCHCRPRHHCCHWRNWCHCLKCFAIVVNDAIELIGAMGLPNDPLTVNRDCMN